MDIQTEVEGNVRWQIHWAGSRVIIAIETLDCKHRKIIEYNCQYPPIAGYDQYDVIRINEILDEWITHFKSKGE